MNHDRRNQERKFYILGIVIIVFVILFTTFSLVGCNTPKPMVTTTSNTEVKHDSTTNTTTEITTNETIKESDVAQSVDADSAYAALQFECDSLGNVLMKSLEQEQGKRTSLELQLKDNILKIQAIQEEFEVIVKGLKRDKEVLIKENTELKEKLSSVQSQEKQEPVIVEKPIPAIVKWFAWIGAFFVVFYLVKFGLWVYRKFTFKV
jgi:hypothetical protein